MYYKDMNFFDEIKRLCKVRGITVDELMKMIERLEFQFMQVGDREVVIQEPMIFINFVTYWKSAWNIFLTMTKE